MGNAPADTHLPARHTVCLMTVQPSFRSSCISRDVFTDECERDQTLRAKISRVALMRRVLVGWSFITLHIPSSVHLYIYYHSNFCGVSGCRSLSPRCPSLVERMAEYLEGPLVGMERACKPQPWTPSLPATIIGEVTIITTTAVCHIQPVARERGLATASQG